MNWLTFAITAYVLFAAEVGLRGLWHIGQVHPSLLLILMVFIGLTASSHTVAWSALILGLLTDLQPTTDTSAILGPAALGYLVGAYAVVQLRNLLFRESILTLAIMVFAVGIFVNLTEVTLYSFRGMGLFAGDPIPGWSASAELVTRFLRLLYSAAVAIPLGFLLFKSLPFWHFATGPRSDRGF